MSITALPARGNDAAVFRMHELLANRHEQIKNEAERGTIDPYQRAAITLAAANIRYNHAGASTAH